MDSQSEAINGSNNSYDTGAMCNKIIGQTYSQLPSSRITPGPT